MLTREQILIIVGITLINFNLYFLNEELLIYSTVLTFITILYFAAKKAIAHYFFSKSYDLHCHYIIYHITEEIYHHNLKLALIEAQCNLNTEKKVFDLYNIVLRNHAILLRRFIKFIEAIRHKFIVRNMMCEAYRSIAPSKNIAKLPGKSKPGKLW